jgi:hypothetical protein
MSDNDSDVPSGDGVNTAAIVLQPILKSLAARWHNTESANDHKRYLLFHQRADVPENQLRAGRGE